MDTSFGILTLLPPLIAIGLAIWKKQLFPAIILGILTGEIIIARGNVINAVITSLDDSLRIFGDKVNLQIILFSLLAGGLLRLIRESNGFIGFIEWFEKKKLFRQKKTVYPLTYLLNISLFIDSWSSILITGSMVRSIYTKFKISRERLAYFLHTIAINFVALAILNSWGAYYMSLLRAQNIENPLRIILNSLPFNFYCIGSLVLIVVVMLTDLTIGPMRKADRKIDAIIHPESEQKEDTDSQLRSQREGPIPSAMNLILPLAVLIVLVFLGLYISGEGSIVRGSGSASLFNGACITIALMSIFYFIRGIFRFEEILEIVFKGMADLLPIGVLIVLAMTIGDVCKQVGTGVYLADVVKHNIPLFLLPALIFVISCIISFATGTSYGTFAIMVPIAMPMATTMGMNPALMFGACIGGGVFGDNCSPISDTSILTGMITEIEVIEHVRTQIPYAVITAGISILLYLLIGLFQ